jgi:glutamate/tyrosine decarboxylase-like PLP-dependent enzyme
MANFVGLLAARRARAPWDVRTEGTGRGNLRVYVSQETHTWIEKAADMFGLGTSAIRWIATDDRQRIDVGALREAIRADRSAGLQPFLVVGTAGTVSTGAIDPLPELAAVCAEEQLWFHVDGAYGAPAAVLPEAPEDLRALALADSLALDPHKWLYSPVEAGCVLVRDAETLRDAFSYRPPYYRFYEERLNYFEYGPQNSRQFRALKVWIALRQVGREGYVQMLRDDVAFARLLHELADADPELEAATTSLSITTFRYVPRDVDPADDEYLNALNEEIAGRIESGGEAFVSNAVIAGRFLLRACIVNFRTGAGDIRALVALVKRVGAEAHAELRRQAAPR